MPTSLLPVICILLLDAGAGKYGGMVDSNIVNSFPLTALSGMLMNALNSARSIAYNSAIHLKIIQTVGWTYAVTFGFVLQATILFIYGFIVEWVEEGILPEVDATKPADFSARHGGERINADV